MIFSFVIWIIEPDEDEALECPFDIWSHTDKVFQICVKVSPDRSCDEIVKPILQGENNYSKFLYMVVCL